jgi:hypothetical protein
METIITSRPEYLIVKDVVTSFGYLLSITSHYIIYEKARFLGTFECNGKRITSCDMHSSNIITFQCYESDISKLKPMFASIADKFPDRKSKIITWYRE